MRRAVPLLAALALLAGCSETTGGSPTPGGADPGGADPTSTGRSAAPAPSSKKPVERPRTIDLKDVDPCTALTEAQRAQFGLTVPPVAGTDSTLQARSCDFSREDREWGVRVAAVTTTGVEWYTDGRFNAEAEELEVGGFPAVLGRTPDDPGACYLGVDVSDGQMVDVQLSTVDGPPQEELCQLATQLARAVVETIAAG